MDHGDSLLDIFDESDLGNVFGGSQNEGPGSLFSWADEFLGDESEAAANSLAAMDTGNLATNVNPSNLLLNTQNYAVTSSVPAQNITPASSNNFSLPGVTVSPGHAQQGMMVVGGQQTVVNAAPPTGLNSNLVKTSSQPLIIKTSSGQQIQLSNQAQLHFLQQQQQFAGNTTFNSSIDQQQQPASGMAQQHTTVIGRSVTPGSANTAGVSGLQFGSAQVTPQSIPQLKRASPAPNINLVHLPPQQQQQQQQFQIAPGTILQLPSAAGGATQTLAASQTLFQGQSSVLGNTAQQAGNLIQPNTTVIQNQNIVNVAPAQQQVICNTQPQRNNLGINIQGTLIQTAEGKSILIPSQNIGQPINIQGLSVATAAPPAIQQTTQNTLANMLLAQQQQQQPTVNMDNRSNQGLQPLVLNHQGQQILVQRSGTPNASQNIVLRTAGTPSNIVQVQQRPTQSPQQIQNLFSGVNTQQQPPQQQQLVKVASQAQSSGLQMVNIGGNNVSLQQLTNQLANIQGLQLNQQQQTMTFQQQGQANTAAQINFPQGVTLQQPQGQMDTSGSMIVQQQQVLGAGSPVTNVQATNSASSVENQTRLILQQIQQSLRKSQANTISSSPQMPSKQQTVPNAAVMQIKQEPKQEPSCYGSAGAQSNNLLSQAFSPAASTVKTEPTLIQSLLKQEADVKPCVNTSSISDHPSSSIHALLTGNNTQVTTTVSQASTQMSLFVLSNSSAQNVLSNSSSSINSATVINSTMTSAATSQSGNNLLTSPDSSNQVQASSQQQAAQGGASMQTIHLPPELKQQFQKLQLEMHKIQASTQLTAEQKRNKLMQLQGFQKRILLKGRVLATTKAEPSQIRQGLVSLSDTSISSSTPVTVSSSRSNAEAVSEVQPIPSSDGQGLVYASAVSSSQSTQANASPFSTLKLPKHQSLGPFQGQIDSTFVSPVPTNQPAASNYPSKPAAPVKQQRTPPSAMDRQTAATALTNQQTAATALTSQQTAASTLTNQQTAASTLTNQQTAASTLTNQQTAASTLPNQHTAASTLTNRQTPSSSALANQQVVSASASSNQQFSSTNQQMALSTPQSQAVTVTTQSMSQPVTQATASTSAAPQVAVPTQIKIADKVLTLSLTPAQKDKVQLYLDRMTPDEQQQYLQTQHHVLQRIQKQQQLSAQIRAQVEAQKKLAANKQAVSPTPGRSSTVSVTPEKPHQSMEVSSQPDSTSVQPSTTQQSPVQQKLEVKSIPVPITQASTSSSVPKPDTTSTATPTAVPIRATKRSFLDIPKGTLINQQIRQDQNHAVSADAKRPFRSKGDACRRLLRFHVFQMYGPSPEEFRKFDSHMEDISAELLGKKDTMLEKYRHLQFQETTRVQPSSELVMLQRMQNQELRKLLEEERQLVAEDPESFVPMPSKYLFRTAGQLSSTSTSSSENGQGCVEDDDDNMNTSGEHLDQSSDPGGGDDISYRDSIDEVPTTSEGTAVKVRKLVIKSDGMNFISAFKRKSMDQIQSTMELCESIEENETIADNEQKGLETASLHSLLKDDSLIPGPIVIEDEDTNEYSSDRYTSMDAETERAALAISSADESEDPHTDDGDYSNENSSNISSQLSAATGSSNVDFQQSGSGYYYQKHESSASKSRTSDKFSSYSQQGDVHGHKDSDFIPTHSPLSNVDAGEHVAMGDSLLGSEGLDDSIDKFDMYQPITECLTDSEENSFYTADATADRTVVNDNMFNSSSGWQKSSQSSIRDSENDSDHEVKAQMESAIKSILSQSHSSSDTSAASYSYSQSNQFFNPNNNQSNSMFHASNDLELPSEQSLDGLVSTDQSQCSLDTDEKKSDSRGGDRSAAGSSEGTATYPHHDLDAAVNSILM